MAKLRKNKIVFSVEFVINLYLQVLLFCVEFPTNLQVFISFKNKMELQHFFLSNLFCLPWNKTYLHVDE